MCDEKQNAWWSIDFKTAKIRPTHYTMRHYTTWNIEALRSWRFEGSNDAEKWSLIKEHDDDDSLKVKDAAHTWHIEHCRDFYRYFRVYMTKKNDNNHWFLACSGFEIYGDLSTGSQYCPYLGSADDEAAMQEDEVAHCKGILWRLAHAFSYDEKAEFEVVELDRRGG